MGVYKCSLRRDRFHFFHSLTLTLSLFLRLWSILLRSGWLLLLSLKETAAPVTKNKTVVLVHNANTTPRKNKKKDQILFKRKQINAPHWQFPSQYLPQKRGGGEGINWVINFHLKPLSIDILQHRGRSPTWAGKKRDYTYILLFYLIQLSPLYGS